MKPDNIATDSAPLTVIEQNFIDAWRSYLLAADRVPRALSIMAIWDEQAKRTELAIATNLLAMDLIKRVETAQKGEAV